MSKAVKITLDDDLLQALRLLSFEASQDRNNGKIGAGTIASEILIWASENYPELREALRHTHERFPALLEAKRAREARGGNPPTDKDE